MAASIKILRSITPGARPSGKVYGEPYVNLGDNQLGVFDSGNVARDLIGVPVFSAAKAYTAGQAVSNGGIIYIAKGAVSAGSFNSAQWSVVAPLDSPTFIGDPKAPTPATADNDTSIATTAFAKAAIAADAGRSRVLIINQSIAGINSAGINFDTYPGYDSYEFEILAFASVAGTFLAGRVSIDGSTFFAGATDYYTGFIYGASDTTGAYGGTKTTLMQLSTGSQADAAHAIQSIGHVIRPTYTGSGYFRSVQVHTTSFYNSEIYNFNASSTLMAVGSVWKILLFQFNDGSNFNTASWLKVWGLK